MARRRPSRGRSSAVPASIEHCERSRPASASKLKVGRGSSVGAAGPPVIESVGAVVSRLKLCVRRGLVTRRVRRPDAEGVVAVGQV